jgi:cysteine desulfurase
MTSKRYYFDHSATTYVDPAVAAAMADVMTKNFGNPSSIHGFGRDARVILEDARETLAQILNAQPSEIFFTSGGTEADNLALIGAMEANRDRGNHIITSKIEHHAVLDSAEYLENNGFRVSYVSPDRYGVIQPDEVLEAVTPETVLISIMHVNNETGTINPIDQIGKIARERRILFHTDAVQSFGKIEVDVEAINADLLSISGHKIYGPKGVGALYARKGVNLTRRTFGGHQEREVRTGTENLPGAVGLAVAARKCAEELESEAERLKALRDRLWNGLQEKLPDLTLNGHPEKRLPGLNNISFKGVEGEALLLSLDLKGIAASTGSACSSGQTSASHVLLSMGIAPEIAQGSIRFSLGRENDADAIDYLLRVVPEIVTNLRQMSF